jgi:hypothetical protein
MNDFEGFLKRELEEKGFFRIFINNILYSTKLFDEDEYLQQFGEISLHVRHFCNSLLNMSL